MGLPASLGFRAGLLEMNGGIDVIHPRQGNEMMLATGVRIVLGQLHLITPRNTRYQAGVLGSGFVYPVITEHDLI